MDWLVKLRVMSIRVSWGPGKLELGLSQVRSSSELNTSQTPNKSIYIRFHHPFYASNYMWLRLTSHASLADRDFWLIHIKPVARGEAPHSQSWEQSRNPWCSCFLSRKLMFSQILIFLCQVKISSRFCLAFGFWY